ncbi:MAG: Pr6Pr family membrane protein, partial [Chloroflexota bacterium]|nr:Pr6Pr family membrane protein [Chloroflexota bacterium]
MDLTDRQALARGWSGLTAVVSLLGVLLSAIVAYRADEGFFSGAWERFFNTFAFFTIQSNTLVAITSLLLYLNRNRTSTVFRIVWLTALVAISITGVVYHWLLAASQDLEGLALVSDFIVHTVVPIMAVVGFFVFGPRGLVTPAVVRLTLIFFI